MDGTVVKIGSKNKITDDGVTLMNKTTGKTTTSKVSTGAPAPAVTRARPAAQNNKKANALYKFIDESSFYSNNIDIKNRY